MSSKTIGAPPSAGTSARSSTGIGRGFVALAVEPTQQDCDRPGVMAQVVGCSSHDPELSVTVGISEHPGIEGRYRLVI